MPEQKKVELVTIDPPPAEQQVRRPLEFAGPDEKKTRYSMPLENASPSPVGYRTRVSMTKDEASEALELLSLERPTSFVTASELVTERELFEESTLGIMSARQSTNYRGHRQVTLGPGDSAEVAAILRDMKGLEGDALDDAEYTHIVLSKPYRTPFTLLLTFIGHKPIVSLLTVAKRALDKRFKHIDDIPTIGYLQQLHVGILADAMERAAVVASGDRRQANVFSAPFCGTNRDANRGAIKRLEQLAGMSGAERAKGWRVALVAQVGTVPEADRVGIAPQTCRKLGANMLAFRSERIQPGVNAEDSAPEPYQKRQDMDVPDELTVMAGRAAYNAFVHWTGCDRERSKDLLLLERIDVLTPNGKERLRDVRKMLDSVTDSVMKGIPLWADLPTGKAFSRNASRGKKAFALAGQRIYIGGLDRGEIEAEGLDWTQSLRAFGAAAARSSLVAELMGCVDMPENCDLLAGICLMAGPVNQNDIGKEFFGQHDLLKQEFGDKDPTSLLVWTLKAKTVADPIGNEEQLLNARRKGALVDLRPGPHDVVSLRRHGKVRPMRKEGERVNTERAFGDVGNFVVSDDGREIPGNRGSAWPDVWAKDAPWS